MRMTHRDRADDLGGSAARVADGDRESSFARPSPLVAVAFVSPRYWPDAEERQEAVARVQGALAETLGEASGGKIQHLTVSSEAELDALANHDMGGTAVFVALSGAVQPWMLRAAERFRAVAIWPAYVPGLLGDADAARLLERNAAPSSLEVFSLLRSTHSLTVWPTAAEDVLQTWKVVGAVERVAQTKLLQIGEPEPWVMSCGRDVASYRERLGLNLESVPPQDLYDRYHAMSPDSVTDLVENWVGPAVSMGEASKQDVADACRVVRAMEELIDEQRADGVVIACFSLIEALGTTSCLALSWLNDDPRRIGVCEGDMDAAATMALLKSLTGQSLWMGNPVVGQSSDVLIAHCTAPRQLCGLGCEYALRCHHESGLGVSPAVQFPVDRTVTLCRIGQDVTAMSLHVGEIVTHRAEPTCRTQVSVRLPSLPRFLDSSLGTHQVLVFGDWREELTLAARLLDLRLS